MHGQQNIKKE